MDDMKNEMVNSLDGFVGEIKQIIDSARANAVRSVDLCRVQMYWNIGKRIFEKEQQGKERADYGSYLIKNLSKRITPDYGSGFSVRQLEMCRQFYRTYPIANTVCSQLNWSQYKLLIAIPDTDKRKYYQLEAVNNGWTKRELERQINSLLYERLLLSNDKEAVLAVAQNQRIPESPTEIIKDPMVLEFLGLERRASYYERDLESAIICTDKNDTAVKLALPENNQTILASKYQLYLPTTEQLINEINEVKRTAEKSQNDYKINQ